MRRVAQLVEDAAATNFKANDVRVWGALQQSARQHVTVSGQRPRGARLKAF